MKAVIQPAQLRGRIRAIASKSQAHRMLICAAFADAPTDIICRELSQDIEATAGCLKAMGSDISYDAAAGVYHVVPVKRDDRAGALAGALAGIQGTASAASGEDTDRDAADTGEAHTAKTAGQSEEAGAPVSIDVGESGSTLRFLLPVVCALGLRTHIVMHGRLSERPLSPLWEELEAHGAVLARNADGSIEVSGHLTGSRFTMAANVSSQFISGLLFAMPLIGHSQCSEPEVENESVGNLCRATGEMTLTLTGSIESKNYILMTLDALRDFGITVDWEGDRMRLSPDAAYRSPGRTKVEGDWSNGAFWICAAAMSGKQLTIDGLNPDSSQGDRAVVRLRDLIRDRSAGGGDTAEAAAPLQESKADIVSDLQSDGLTDADRQGSVMTQRPAHRATEIDARDVPDLVPVLSILAASVSGETVFTHAERLRIKESDRIRATVDMLRSLGADAEETADGLLVRGTGRLRGGCVDSVNDHRIAMSAAVASMLCEEEVTVRGAQAVRKSYPDFWKDFESLGGSVRLLPDDAAT